MIDTDFRTFEKGVLVAKPVPSIVMDVLHSDIAGVETDTSYQVSTKNCDLPSCKPKEKTGKEVIICSHYYGQKTSQFLVLVTKGPALPAIAL